MPITLKNDAILRANATHPIIVPNVNTVSGTPIPIGTIKAKVQAAKAPPMLFIAGRNIIFQLSNDAADSEKDIEIHIVIVSPCFTALLMILGFPARRIGRKNMNGNKTVHQTIAVKPALCLPLQLSIIPAKNVIKWRIPTITTAGIISSNHFHHIYPL